VYANRRRMQGEYGKSLLRRGELVEQLCAVLRDGGDAARQSARTGKHLEAATDPRGCVQSKPDPPPTAGRAGTAREWKNRFGRLVLTLYLPFTCRMNQKQFCRSRISASVANAS
jgi:hypothetical protein